MPYNGWLDEREEEREGEDAFEDLGKYDAFEGWPEGSTGPEYWLNKGINRKYPKDED